MSDLDVNSAQSMHRLKRFRILIVISNIDKLRIRKREFAEQVANCFAFMRFERCNLEEIGTCEPAESTRR